MTEEVNDLILKKGKCCVTGQPFKSIHDIMWIQLSFEAQWKFPVWGNVLYEIPTAFALAVLDANCLVNGKLTGPVKYAIEINDQELTFHPVPSCRKCGCTDDWCLQCIEKTGKSCTWIEKDLCSACHETAPKPKLI